MSRLHFLVSVLAVAILFLSACSEVGYYTQCATGHIGVLSRCQPITSLLEDPQTSAELKAKLELVLAIRQFASGELALPDNDSYRSYGDLGRPYVVWNVVVAEEFSLTPRQWCFPVAGCVSYRGYFTEEGAESFAQKQQGKGHDVYVYGVAAYSTLSWFDDPVLNTFLDRPQPALAGLIFHELAHQVVYAEDDSPFNEAFATAVEIEGVRRWLQRQGDEAGLARFDASLQRQQQFVALLSELKEELRQLYREDTAEEGMRLRKEELLAGVDAGYRDLREQWGGFAGYDAFFEGGLNNAKLASVSTYQDLVPAFQRLLVECGHNLPTFYLRVAELAELPVAERQARLNESTRLARKDTPPATVAD